MAGQVTTQTGARIKWLVAALASALVAAVLVALRPGCASHVGDAQQRALDHDPGEVNTPPKVVAPAANAPSARREADASRAVEDRGATIAGGESAAARSVESSNSDVDDSKRHFLTLEVVQTRGAPVPRAKVTVDQLWFHPSATPSVLDTLELTADANGRVHFDFLAGLGEDLGGALALQVGLACTATDGGGGASPELLLTPPVQPGSHTLVLGAAAAVTVEVVEGSPPLAVAGADVHLDRMGRESQRPVRATTDTRGFARFSDLSPGAWSYYVQPQGAEHNVRAQFELAAGENRALTVTLDEGEEALAVAGRFVDEEGKTIELGPDDHPKLWVGANLTEFGTATGPSGDGTFRVYLPRSAEVLVRNFGGHRYEPELARVSFGTQDLVLRRVERFSARTIVVEARDGADGALLVQPHLTVYEDDARTANGMSLVKRPSPGRLETTLLARPTTRLAVWADGYAPRFMALPPSGATSEAPLVVHLEVGGPRELNVLDAATLQPIASVDLVDKDGSSIATTDGTGRTGFRVDQPGWLSLRRGGYVSQRFHPTWPWDRVFLTRE
jgi:hypothetical protein